MNHWDDTIIALATPSGIGALAVLRISGPKAFEVFQVISPKSRMAERPSHQAFVARIFNLDQQLDEALIIKFSGPNSFTGEDVVEISLHGSQYIVQEVIKVCLTVGCRLAEPGEFTQRAFLNRKLDLAQAEAVADLIASESEAAHRTALHQLKGGLSKEIHALRQDLIDFTALIELELDFSEEDVEFADRTKLMSLVQGIISHIKKLIHSFSTGQAIRNGIPIVIVGPPNAGKSTLLNALLQEEKAIVSHIAGTTRDVIEDVLILNGITFRFVDTAGLRKTEDFVENIGISKTREQLDKASFALLLQAPDSLEKEVESIEAEIQERALPYLKIRTKADLIEDNYLNDFFLSAVSGQGLEELKNEIVRRSVDRQMLNSETALITNLRHYHALRSTLESLIHVEEAIDTGLTGDLLATDIREALFHLGSITGEITVEDVLGSIFSKFCIGK
jgi:tRNA modification GTPase